MENGAEWSCGHGSRAHSHLVASSSLIVLSTQQIFIPMPDRLPWGFRVPPGRTLGTMFHPSLQKAKLIHLLVEEAEISPLQVGKLRLRSEIMCPAPTMPPPAVGLTSHPGAQGRGPRTSAWRGSQPLQPRTLLAPCPFPPLLVFLSETWWGVTLSLLY